MNTLRRDDQQSPYVSFFDICLMFTSNYGAIDEFSWKFDSNNTFEKLCLIHEDQKVAAVLGKALCWTCFDGVFQDMVPTDLCGTMVHAQYKRIRTLSSDVSPVKNVSVVVCGHGGQLFVIDKLLDPGTAVLSDLSASHDAVQSSSYATNEHRRRAWHIAEI